MRALLRLLMGLGLGVAACRDPTSGTPDDPLEHETEASSEDGGATTDADADTDANADAWGEPRPLLVAEAWQPTSAANDPLAHERPAQVDCPSAAWGPELHALEIQTGVCNYFAAAQPSLVAIEAGDAIEVVVLHDRLDAAEPAEGHVALLLGDAVVWEARVEIPAEAHVLEARVLADRAWPAGTAVGLHLHNHGYNSWKLVDVSVAPRDERSGG